MRGSKNGLAYLLPSSLLFFGSAVFLFRNPTQYPLILLLFFAYVLATLHVTTLEMAAVFATFVTFMQWGCSGLGQGLDKLWPALYGIPLWCGIYTMHQFVTRENKDEKGCSHFLQNYQKGMATLQKEKQGLDHRIADLDKQLTVRKNLSQAVHELASLLDPMLVRQRLMEFVRTAIGKGNIQFFAGTAPRDLMDQWVMERKLSLLVTDVLQDSRFKNAKTANEVRSVLAAPILVEKQVVGVIRLNAFEANVFSIGDLRILEALSLLASLALENLQLLSKLQEGAVRDSLTGLYTHRFLQERLADEILRAGRYSQEFSLLLMDIDHFKRYNDTYGHAAGDQVLIRVSQLIQQLVRPVDLVCRYGGEEFVVLMPQAPLGTARELAERIRQTLQQESFHFGTEASMQEHVTISIGLAGFPNEATIASQLIRVADSRLYQAKESGRNRVIG